MLNKFSKLLLALAIFSALVLGGCIALTSETNDEGMVYYLPKSLLRISVRQLEDASSGRVWYELGADIRDADGNPKPNNALIPSETVPDPLHRYVIKYHPSKLSDDRLCISRSATGLLNDVQFVADDRTPQIVFNIARFIAGTIPQDVGASITKPKDTNQVTVREYTSRVDPFDNDDVAAYNRALGRYFGENVKVSFARMRRMISASASTWPKGCSLKDGCSREAWQKRCEPGQICYRTKMALPVDLKQNGLTIDANYADIVNSWDIGAISVTRAFLVQKMTGLKFDKGSLVAAVIRKPSEVEELTLLPLNVVHAALSVPSGLFAQAFGTSNDDKEQLIASVSKLQSDVSGLKASAEGLALNVGNGTATDNTTTYQLNCGQGVNSGIFNWQVKVTP